jgi:hypothetical protein
MPLPNLSSKIAQTSIVDSFPTSTRPSRGKAGSTYPATAVPLCWRVRSARKPQIRQKMQFLQIEPVVHAYGKRR